MKIIRHTESDIGFPYIAYVPDTLSEHPGMIFQLHGAGERGDAPEELDLVTVHGFSHVVSDENLKDTVLVLPQCSVGTFWVARIESLKRFMDALIEEYAADPKRVTLCGISMGGFGAWYTAQAFPHMFAAIAPCCGGGMVWMADVLRMPIRAFHGSMDEVVSPLQSMEMIRKIERHNPNATLTLYDGVGHDSWVYAFSEELLLWLQEQRLS